MAKQEQHKNPFGDKKTALAFFLSLIVIITYTEVILKPDSASTTTSEIASTTTQQNTPLHNAQSGPIPTGTPAAIMTTSPEKEKTSSPLLQELPTMEEIKQSPRITIHTSKYEAVILQLGGQLQHFRLRGYTKELGGKEPLDLVAFEENAPLPFGVSILGGTDRKIQFTAPIITPAPSTDTQTITVQDGKETQVTFQIPLESGGTYTKTYRFTGGSYFVELNAELSAPPAGSLPLQLTWSSFISEERAKRSYDPMSFSFLFPNEKVEHIKLTELKEAEEKQDKVARWGSLGDKYFMISLIATGDSEKMVIGRSSDNYFMTIIGDSQKVGTKAYLGPKNYSGLKKLNYAELHRNVNLGIFTFLAIPLLTVLNFFYGILGNYGLAIILLTLLLKFAFLPLTGVSIKSMKAMQDLQPEIAAMKERTKDSNQVNQEMMALYKKNGVNPMGGCLPMLIQIPVFLGLYNALLNATELRHAPFALWVTDLSAPEALQIFGHAIPVMIILMGLSMFFQQLLMPSNADPQQKKIMMMMPVVFTTMFIIFPFPSGLVLYWLVNNLISIVQQVYLRTERSLRPMQATAIASIAIFLVGFICTQIS